MWNSVPGQNTEEKILQKQKRRKLNAELKNSEKMQKIDDDLSVEHRARVRPFLSCARR